MNHTRPVYAEHWANTLSRSIHVDTFMTVTPIWSSSIIGCRLRPCWMLYGSMKLPFILWENAPASTMLNPFILLCPFFCPCCDGPTVSTRTVWFLDRVSSLLWAFRQSMCVWSQRRLHNMDHHLELISYRLTRLLESSYIAITRVKKQ